MLFWSRTIKLLTVLVLLTVCRECSFGVSYARQYPLKQVSKPKDECKSVERSELDDSCKMPLPRILNGDYNLYKENRVTRAVYSDVWGWTYQNGRDTDTWWAPSTDISTALWTPVYAIGKGKVIWAWELRGYGYSITIEHDLWWGKKIRSSYSHLSKIHVDLLDKVEEWDLIGEVGKSGFTMWKYGNHLDFAITTTKQKYYPYSYGDCKAGYMKAVEQWSCRDLMAKNTVDPLLFLELWGKLDTSVKLAKATVESSKLKKQVIIPNNPKVKSNAVKALDTAKLALINEKIYKVKKDNLTIEIVDLERKNDEALSYKWKAYVTVVVTKDGKPYDGYLGKEIAFISKNKAVGIGWWTINYVKWGEKTVILYGDQKGDDEISVKIGDEIIWIHHTKVS